MAAESFDHILLSGIGRSVDFTPVGKPGEQPPFPFLPNRRTHADKLSTEIKKVEEVGADKVRAQARVLPKKERGLLVRFNSRTEYGIDLSFFRKSSHRLELLSSGGEGKRHVVRAFAPLKSFDVLERAAEKFGASSVNDERQPRFSNFFEQVERVSPAAVSKLWNPPTDAKLPKEGKHLWEVWVRPRVVRWVRKVAKNYNIEIDEHETEFPTATVIRMRGKYDDLSNLLIATAAVIEIRPASKVVPPPMDLTPLERVALVRAIKDRLQLAPDGCALTTILDTGVRYQHALLQGSLPPTRAHTILPAWPPEDVLGHGTQMAGAALFGDLNKWLSKPGPIPLESGLESVAMIGAGWSGLSGPTYLLDQALRKVERNSAPRVYSISFRIPTERVDGAPTELSSHIDQLAFSRRGQKRLFCVAAGNIDQDPLLVGDYIGSNDRLGIETPGQSPNALTVGAYTALTSTNGMVAHAQPGDLCPTARTAIPWTIHLAHKPDIVMEGGNRAIDDDGVSTKAAAELSVLTTCHEIPNRPFAAGSETSIATAAAAGLASRLMTAYPTLWPETIRGLVVHSAKWTPAMLARKSGRAKTATLQLIQRFGWGVPNEERARRSASNALTLIVQDEMTPFKRSKNGGLQYSAMKFYRLPWPREALEAISAEQVSMRVTLSYFAEPHPLALSHKNLRDYFSHGLTFDVNEPDDGDDEAIARINAKHRAAGHKAGKKRRATNWTLGTELRARGTLRQDEWHGHASDLARKNGLSVFPEYGWWSSFKTSIAPEAKVRFALIVSIESSDIELDLRLPVELPTRQATVISTRT
jgi:hypothetical protein